jgi:benzoylformate decarboxylase
MRARHVFLDSLRLHGVSRIFGNPGTTESPLLDSLRDYPDVGYVTALHEGVAVTAAHYFAQASGETGVANVHVAPGLGNGLGSLYGALRARTPLILTAGAQDTRMRMREPMLGHDLAAMARPLTKWSTQVEHADEMAAVMARAFKIANEPPCGPVFVALPINVMEQQTEVAAWHAGQVFATAHADAQGLAQLASVLAGAERPAIVCGDEVAIGRAVEPLVRLAEASGAAVFHEGLRQHLSFPNRHPNSAGSLGFEAAGIRGALSHYDVILLVGGPFFEEIWFDPGSAIPADAQLLQLSASHDTMARNFPVGGGVVGALAPTIDALVAEVGRLTDADAVGQRNTQLAELSAQRRAGMDAYIDEQGDHQPMSSARAMREIAAAMPEHGVVVDESITALGDVAHAFDLQRAGDYFGPRGGGIGQGIAGALGVKVAMPERPVICISGDGSAMYHIQALWTAARLDLGIVFVILNNSEYRVLKHNLDAYRQRFDAQSNEPYPYMDIGPELDFVSLARGMGVAASAVQDPTELRACIEAAFATGRPHLVSVRVAGKES